MIEANDILRNIRDNHDLRSVEEISAGLRDEYSRTNTADWLKEATAKLWEVEDVREEEVEKYGGTFRQPLEYDERPRILAALEPTAIDPDVFPCPLVLSEAKEPELPLFMLLVFAERLQLLHDATKCKRWADPSDDRGAIADAVKALSPTDLEVRQIVHRRVFGNQGKLSEDAPGHVAPFYQRHHTTANLAKGNRAGILTEPLLWALAHPMGQTFG